MATSTTGKKCCVMCDNERSTSICEGCFENYCYEHLGDHRQQLNKLLDEIEINSDLFQQSFFEQKQNPKNHILLQQISKWEEESIKNIQQTAKDVRQTVFEYTNDYTQKIETKLSKLTNEIRQSRKENDFNEIDLRHFDGDLKQLTKELNRLSNTLVREDSNLPLVNKISVYTSDNKFQIKITPWAACDTSEKANEVPFPSRRPLSAFFLFAQDERPHIEKNNPTMSVGDISYEIGKKWKILSEDVRKRYERLAAAEKQRYEMDLLKYKKSMGGRKPSKSKSFAEDNDDDDDDDD